MKSREIYILEDDALVRKTLSVILDRAGYQPICFADGGALIARAREKYPLCILLDLRLPGKSGMEILSELQGEDYLAPVILISGYGSIEIAVEALQNGAADFIQKPFKANEIIDRIDRIERTIAKARAYRTAARLAIDSNSFSAWQVLTRREGEILNELLSGETNKEIARRLGLSPRTVETHRLNIMKKANVKSIAQLMLNVLQPNLESKSSGKICPPLKVNRWVAGELVGVRSE
jgi:FixJ family two-component response regulator